jgi:hypothetical protein
MNLLSNLMAIQINICTLDWPENTFDYFCHNIFAHA